MTALTDGVVELISHGKGYYVTTVIITTVAASAAGSFGIVADGPDVTGLMIFAGGFSSGLFTLVVSWLLAFWAAETWRAAKMNRMPVAKISIEDTQPVRANKHPELEQLPEKWREQARRHEATTTGPFRVVSAPKPTGPIVNPDVMRMWKLAKAYPLKMTLAEREWDDGHPFGGGEFRELLRYMTRERLIEWKHPTSKNQGRDFTRAGLAAMRFYQTRPTPPPWPDVPGSKIA